MLSIRRMLSTLVMAAALPIGGFALAPMTASAHPALASATCGYPPHHCFVVTDKTRYHKGSRVRFHVPNHAFNRHGKVVPVIVKKDPYRHVFHAKHANAKGGLNASVRLPLHMPKGRYAFILKGHKHGHRVKLVTHIRVV